jgi:gamma-glutamyltranspeptidase/glutathione hydrolase
VYLCAVDRWGNSCSFINSNFMGFGTGIVPEGCGYTLQNRGHGFVLEQGMPNSIGPGRRPYHTIIPGMLTADAPGGITAPLGVMGGMMQPQGHLQVVRALCADTLDPQAALDRARIQLADGRPDGAVQCEAEANAVALSARGHEVQVFSPESRAAFGLGQIIVQDRESNWAGSAPRVDGLALAEG